MRSKPVGTAQSILASQIDSLRDDGRGGSFLLAHQQLGALALGTNPSNNQVVPIVVNGTTITVTFVTSIGSTPNNVLIGASAAASVANLVNFLRRPDLTSSTQVAASGANQSLLQYVGWALPGSSTNIVPFSLNKNVNGATGALTSFNITGITVTGGTWTAQTMQLYVEEGTYYIGTTRVLFTGGSTPTVTAPVSNPRIDILTADSSGTLAWTTGTENASPSAPSYPANKVVICELYNVVGETALYDNENQQTSQGYIYNDVRNILAPVYVNSSSQIANGTIVAANLAASVGVTQSGMVVMWTTTSAPSGWLFCDGSAVSRTTYATLFGVIGTTFGSGDGSTTFNVPDMRGRAPIGVGTGTGGGSSGNGAPTGGSALSARSLADWAGEETHALSVGELPSHNHTYSVANQGGGGTGSATAGPANGTANTGSTGSGTAHNTVQPVLALEFIIKT